MISGSMLGQPGRMTCVLNGEDRAEYELLGQGYCGSITRFALFKSHQGIVSGAFVVPYVQLARSMLEQGSSSLQHSLLGACRQ